MSARAEGSASDEAHGGSSRSEAEASPDHRHWFEPIADHLGGAYLRYSFTKGTRKEIDFLADALHLQPGMRVLDVGCGPGRHAYELARRGLVVHGIDISERFVELAAAEAPEGATFERLDARDLGAEDRFHGQYDVVICLCQGAFGLMTANGDDEVVLAGMARALRPGGRLALSAFNAYFAVKYFAVEGGSEFDAATGVNHEHTEVRNEAGEAKAVDLWTGCYTPRELRVLCRVAGLEVEAINSVEPGGYGSMSPTTETSEFLVIARRN
ncbi:MAG: class I SAM-dependent methyltransferase [Actinomycetota bacterium]|nr:class I SAM-dependent methyltransferase [Actinomycetota bacterium]